MPATIVLSARKAIRRVTGVQAINHYRAQGMGVQEAVIDAVGRPHRIQPSLVSFEQTFKVGKHGSGDA